MFNIVLEEKSNKMSFKAQKTDRGEGGHNVGTGQIERKRKPKISNLVWY